MAETIPVENGAGPRYEVHECVGRGGVGAVWRAWDRRLGRWVALKRLGQPPGMLPDQVEARVRREASALAALQHPNIVTVHDFGADEQGPFVIMEFIDGLTLEGVVENSPLDRDSFFSLVEQTLAGVDAAHRVDLLHRDLKPGNLMLAWPPGGGDFQVKILDFGLAKFSAVPLAQTLDQGDSLFGSIYCMAPEQFRREPLDVRTDLYALGCIFYYALTGAHPFTGNSVAEVMSSHLHHRLLDLAPQRPDLPAAVSAWILRLLALSPDDRPGTAGAAITEWRALTRGVSQVPGNPLGLVQPSGTGGGPALQSTRASSPRGRLLAGTGVATLVAAGLAAGYVVWTRRQTPPPSPAAAPVAATATAMEGTPAPASAAVAAAGSNNLPAPGGATTPPPAQGTVPTSPLSPPSKPPAALTLEALDAATLRAHLGETVEVRGTPVAAGRSKAGNVLYLNFSARPHEGLALVFFLDRLAVAGGGTTPTLREPGDLQPWIGKPVRVRGQLADYKGDLQIVVNTLDQLQLATTTAAGATP